MRAAEWHLFGRGTSGYATLATSRGLPSGAAAALERFGWGQTSDEAYLGSLSGDPALWVQPVQGGIALTRVLAGDPDASGRATLRFVSLLLDAPVWTGIVAPALASFVRHESLWDPRGDEPVRLPAARPGRPGPAARAGAVAVLDTLQAHPVGTTVVAPPGTLSLGDLERLLRTLPDAELVAFSFAHRALSDGLDVRLISLDAAYAPIRAAHPRAWIGAPQRSGGEVTAESSGSENGLESSRSSSQPRTLQQPSPPSEILAMTRSVLYSFLALALVVCALGGATLMMLSTHETQLEELNRRVGYLQTDLTATQDELAAIHQQLATLLEQRDR